MSEQDLKTATAHMDQAFGVVAARTDNLEAGIGKDLRAERKTEYESGQLSGKWNKANAEPSAKMQSLNSKMQYAQSMEVAQNGIYQEIKDILDGKGFAGGLNRSATTYALFLGAMKNESGGKILTDNDIKHLRDGLAGSIMDPDRQKTFVSEFDSQIAGGAKTIDLFKGMESNLARMASTPTPGS